MKKLFILFLTASLAFTSCSDDDDTTMQDETTEFSVTDLSADSGQIGTEVTINGTGFADISEDITITFGDVEATITSVSGTAIVVTIPESAVSGEVVVTYEDETYNLGTFTVISALVEGTISNLFADQTGGPGTDEEIGGEFTKFDFETGAETDSDTDWDIAFRGTTIAINGGAVTGTADEPARNGGVEAAIATGCLLYTSPSPRDS